MNTSLGNSSRLAVCTAFCALTAIAFLLSSCSASNGLPLDDAYYWADKTEAQAQPAPTAVQPAQTEARTQSRSVPEMEIISSRDTTITVKIKR